MKALRRYGLFVLFPCVIGADQLRFDTRRDWDGWQLPTGAVDASDGTVRARRIGKGTNPALNAPFFGGRVPGAGSNVSDAHWVVDGSEFTGGWAPDPDDPIEDWFIEIDLGRSVSATEVTFVFDQAAPPFRLVNILLSSGESVVNNVGVPVEGTLVYKIRQRIKENDRHRLTYAPGELLDYTAIEAVRLEVLSFEPGARLVEIEVKAIGDNVALYWERNHGGVNMIIDSEVEPRVEGNTRVLVDGSVFTFFPDKREVRKDYDVWWEWTLDLGAVYWVDLVRLIARTALRAEDTTKFRIGDQEFRDRIEDIGPRRFEFKNYEILTSDGSLGPDGRFSWKKQFSGLATDQNRRLGVADHPFELSPTRLVMLRRLAWDNSCAGDLLNLPAGAQGFSAAYGACYARGSGEEYQVFGEGFPTEIELKSGLINLGESKNVTSLRWGAETPPGTRVEVSSRTGAGFRPDTTTFYQCAEIVDDRCVRNGDETTRNNWHKFKEFTVVGGVEVEEVADASAWSPWSNTYLSSGERFQSPSPRQGLELSVRMLSDSRFQAPALDYFEIEFHPPLADSAFGEIFPTQVQPGETTAFAYYIRPLLSRRSVSRIDQVIIEGKVPLRFTEALINGQPIEGIIEDSLVDGFQITLPRTVRNGQIVEVRFESAVFRQLTKFDAFLKNSGDDEDVRQRIDAGDADSSVESEVDAVRLPSGTDLFVGISMEPTVLTPNRDGVNDELRVTLDLLKVIVPRSLYLRVFDLSGTLVHEELKEAVAGPQEFSWDGTVHGRAVSPGLYIVELHMNGDSLDETRQRVLPVVY